MPDQDSNDFSSYKLSTQKEWDDLNIDEQVKKQIQEVQTRLENKNLQLSDQKRLRNGKPGFTILFYGPNGTEKTLAATLIGKYAKKQVYRIDLSAIVSKYIGETEKNLGKIFDLASQKDWILFFDEADALFGKRTKVKDSHDRYANQHANSLIRLIENSNCTIIFSSKKNQNIDEAFLRRLNLIIKFPVRIIK